MKQRILIIAEDASVRAMIARWLMGAGYAVELAESPKRAREAVAIESVALAIVAPQRFGAAGGELARELRAAIGRLIVVGESSADTGGAEMIEADVALSNPLNEAKVLEAVKVALPVAPKEDQEDEPAGILYFEGHVLDLDARQCRTLDGKDVPLTRGEFSMLQVLARKSGRVASRDELSQAVAGRDAGPDDRSVDVLVSRLRRKIEPDPKQPRFIVTVPGEGYRLADAVQAQDQRVSVVTQPALPQSAPTQSTLPSVAAEALTIELSRFDARQPVRRRNTLWVGSAGLGGIAAVLVGFWLWGSANQDTGLPVLGKFDASLVPLINDARRSELAAYPSQPGFKALAISAEGYGMAIGAHDAPSARAEALDRCKARSVQNRYCRLYAVGTDVVWSKGSLPLPLPFDIHAEPLDEAFDPVGLPLIVPGRNDRIPQNYMTNATHKALVAPWTTQGIGAYYNSFGQPLASSAVRTAIEGCADFTQVPCLLVSVDGFWTVRVPKAHRITGLFMLTAEAAMSDDDKQRVGPVYQQADWRALARGKSGWYPVAGASSESVAAEQALARCSEQDSECRIYAISNFRVADDK